MKLLDTNGNVLFENANYTKIEDLLNQAIKEKTNLHQANLSGADLSGADLYRANLYGANLSGANLYGADLIDAILTEAILTGAILTGANLYGAKLAGAILTEAILTGANLYGAKLAGATYGDGTFTKGFKQLLGFKWPVLILDNHIKIGCKFYTTTEWDSFSDEAVNKMHINALEFWKKNKTLIITLAKEHKK